MNASGMQPKKSTWNKVRNFLFGSRKTQSQPAPLPVPQPVSQPVSQPVHENLKKNLNILSPNLVSSPTNSLATSTNQKSLGTIGGRKKYRSTRKRRSIRRKMTRRNRSHKK